MRWCTNLIFATVGSKLFAKIFRVVMEDYVGISALKLNREDNKGHLEEQEQQGLSKTGVKETYLYLIEKSNN